MHLFVEHTLTVNTVFHFEKHVYLAEWSPEPRTTLGFHALMLIV